MLITEEISTAFGGLHSLLKKAEESIKLLVLAEQGKLQDALRSEAEEAKRAEVALLEATTAREAQVVAEARANKLESKLQDKRDELKRLDEEFSEVEEKLLERQRAHEELSVYVDKLEERLRRERADSRREVAAALAEECIRRRHIQQVKGKTSNALLSEERLQGRRRCVSAKSRSRSFSSSSEEDAAAPASERRSRSPVVRQPRDAKESQAPAKIEDGVAEQLEQPEKRVEQPEKRVEQPEKRVDAAQVAQGAGTKGAIAEVGVAAGDGAAGAVASEGGAGVNANTRPKAAQPKPPVSSLAKLDGKGMKGKGKGEGAALCFLFIIDKCKKGAACRDRHPDKREVESMRICMERTPCSFGAQCTRQDCAFKHPPRELEAPSVPSS